MSSSTCHWRRYADPALNCFRWAGLVWITWLVYYAMNRLVEQIACFSWNGERCRAWLREHELAVLVASPGFLWFPILTLVFWPLLPRRSGGVDLPIVVLVLFWSLAMALMFSDPQAFDDI